ncbi:MAG TPA: hypothetical protein VI259_09555 [Gemmatimonadaceae bacterium]
MPSGLRSRRFTLGVFVLAALPAFALAQSTIPARFSDRELWQLNAEISEPGGYFRSDNLLSNETGFQAVIPGLLEKIKPGGVYLGVGPEQNFTYIVALKPKIAIIFDIRRGNMVEHLMYKALLETSADRADFVSKLFSRPRPSGLDTASTAQQLFDAYNRAAPDSAFFRKNLAAIKDFLTKTKGFALGDSDSKSLDYIYGAFFGGGPQINYNYSSGGGGFGGGFGGGMPNYATLQTATDTSGKNWAYLANEANFRWLKDFESKNLLVPVVGDFAGPKAIRTVGKYLKEHNAVVSAMYCSNVEQYLFRQNDDWSRFYANVATLPLDGNSSFIRSIGGGMRGVTPQGNFPRYGGRLANVTSSMLETVKLFNEGKIQSYGDIIMMSR